MGMPRRMAIEIAAQTMLGAATMVLQDERHPAELRDSVTTPGGCTIAGLLAMEEGNVRHALARTIQEATKKAASSGEAKK